MQMAYVEFFLLQFALQCRYVSVVSARLQNAERSSDKRVKVEREFRAAAASCFDR